MLVVGVGAHSEYCGGLFAGVDSIRCNFKSSFFSLQAEGVKHRFEEKADPPRVGVHRRTRH
jgi:hypothetical protein